MNVATKIEVSLVAALAKALPELESAKKNKANPAFKSRYADLAAMIEAIEPIKEYGLWFRQHSHQCDDGVTVETFYIHENGEQLSAGTIHMPASKKDAQGFGSALTYARRYALQTAFGLAVEDDDGNAASKPQNTGRDNTGERQASPSGTNTQPTGMPDAEFARLVQLIEATSTDRSKMLGHFKVKDLRFLNQAQYGEAVEKLTADLAAMAKQETNKTAGLGEILDDEIPY